MKLLKKAGVITAAFCGSLALLMTAALRMGGNSGPVAFEIVGPHPFLSSQSSFSAGFPSGPAPASEYGRKNTDLMMKLDRSGGQGPRHHDFPAARACRLLGERWYMASSSEIMDVLRETRIASKTPGLPIWTSDLSKSGKEWMLAIAAARPRLERTLNPTSRAMVLCLLADN